MTKIKTILFFGLGSIGTRHLQLLKKNYNYEIYAYRTKRDKPNELVKNIYDFNEALRTQPDIVFITNPTYLHINTALSCLRAGIKNFFIEKPLSHNNEKLDIFAEEVKRSGALVYVGYVMRHHPMIKYLKKLIEKMNEKIFYSHTESSSFLPEWRPGVDYRNIYSSKRKQGGGVILDLSHEFDYNQYLFGKINSISGVYGKISNLEIDAEDFCDVFLKFESNVFATIHLDYFSNIAKRLIRILTFKEEILADLINKEIIIKSNQGIKKEKFTFEINDIFEEQLKYFLNGVENQSKKIDNLNETKELLERILEFKNKNKMITT
ncbi:MAG: Gfo/Idh/MocA family protein [Candidatus Hermodarchaeota archaeon]